MQARINKLQTVATDREAAWAVIEAARIESLEKFYAKIKEEKNRNALQQIPMRFKGKTMEDFTTSSSQQEHIKHIVSCYIKKFATCLTEPSSLIFVGKPGTGKTLLALIIHQTLCKAGLLVEYQPSINFLRILQEKQRDSHAGFENMLKHYQQLDFLIIDEVTEGCGKFAMPADWERNLLRTLIDERYQAKRPTLIISNRPKAELISRLGEPTIDRLAENGATLAFNWNSYRQIERK